MTGWDALQAELDRWAEDGLKADLWWRDDDATDLSSNLVRLLRVAEVSAVPLTLAVVPKQNRLTQKDLNTLIVPVQPGYAHSNFAMPTAKKCELGPERRADHVIGELMAGRDALERAFGNVFSPVLVPPWNRLADHLRVMLPDLGYLGLSRFGPRDMPALGPMRVVNTHVDVIDWKGSRGFVGTNAALAQMTAHLQARRQRQVDPDEPTGLLTHHLLHDDDCWIFLARLFDETSRHAAVRWRDATSLFCH